MKTTSFFLTAAILFILSLNVNAQNRIFQKGQLDAQIGVGVVPTYFIDDAKSIMLPMLISVDYFLHKKISVGLLYGHSVYETEPELISDGIFAQRKNQTSVFGLRSAFHVTQFDNWDIYGGFQLSHNCSKIESEAPEEVDEQNGIQPKNNTFTYTGFVGAKYAFAKRIHAFTEIGFDISLLKMGIGIRL